MLRAKPTRFCAATILLCFSPFPSSSNALDAATQELFLPFPAIFRPVQLVATLRESAGCWESSFEIQTVSSDEIQI
jgi:hypothetical protein